MHAVVAVPTNTVQPYEMACHPIEITKQAITQVEQIAGRMHPGHNLPGAAQWGTAP